MAFTVRAVEVFVADVRNRPGMLARVLEALRNAEANLEFVIARRITEDTSRIFVAPLKGVTQRRAAADVGMVPAVGLHTVRIEGPDRAGLAADLSRALAAAEINLRGMSAATIGRKSVIYLAFESQPDADQGTRVVRAALRRK